MALHVRLLGSFLGLGLVAFAVGAGASGARVAGKPLRVGIVLELSQPHSWSPASLEGFERAVRDFGLEGKVVRPSPKEGYLASFHYLGRQGYDLAIGVGISEAEAVYRASLSFPKTRFVILDLPVEAAPTRPPNLEGVVFGVEKAAYLAGYLAALVEERRPGRDVVSAVGGRKSPQVDAFVAGYRAGAQRANPQVVTLYAYAGSFEGLRTARCRNLALDQIAKGSGVVFQVAGACGLGALEAAKGMGVFGIGVDVDQSSLGPHILTSVLKRVDVAVYETIRAATAGRYRGGRTVELGLREGAVGLGRISPRAPRALVARMERMRRLLVSGAIGGIPTTLGSATP